MSNPKDILTIECGKFALRARGQVAVLAVLLGFAFFLFGRLFGFW